MARRSIKRVLVKFILVEFSFSLMSSLLLFFLFNLALNRDVIYMASYPQQVAQEFTDAFKEGKKEVDSLPDFVDYLLVDNQGNVVEKSLENQTELEALLETGKLPQKFSPFHQRQLIKVQRGEQTLFLLYQVTADFKNPWLRAHLPSAEASLFILLLLIIIIGFLVILSGFAKQINRELQKILTVKDQLLVEDLSDKTQEASPIKEIQDILSSLYKMKGALTESLSKEWQQKRQSDAQLRALTHDIKTPVTLVSGNLELLEETDLNEEQTSYVGFSQKGIQQINAYLDDLRHFSGLSEHQPSALRALDTGLVQEFIDFAGQQGQLKKLSIQVTKQEACPEVQLNVNSFQKAYQNILVNAVQYSKEGECIELSFEDFTDYFEIIVSDQGAGFSELSLKQATNEFYTEMTSRSDAHYGLGLSIANRIVQEHQGELILENLKERGEISGARVIIRLRK